MHQLPRHLGDVLLGDDHGDLLLVDVGDGVAGQISVKSICLPVKHAVEAAVFHKRRNAAVVVHHAPDGEGVCPVGVLLVEGDFIPGGQAEFVSEGGGNQHLSRRQVVGQGDVIAVRRDAVHRHALVAAGAPARKGRRHVLAVQQFHAGKPLRGGLGGGDHVAVCVLAVHQHVLVVGE